MLDGPSQAQQIKNAIEDALGIPVLRKTAEVASKLVRNYSKASKEEATKNMLGPKLCRETFRG